MCAALLKFITVLRCTLEHGLKTSATLLPVFHSDPTNFIPTNTPYQVHNVSAWQPLLETNSLGYFTVQTFVTPQARGCVPVGRGVRQAGEAQRISLETICITYFTAQTSITPQVGGRAHKLA